MTEKPSLLKNRRVTLEDFYKKKDKKKEQRDFRERKLGGLWGTKLQILLQRERETWSPRERVTEP